MGLDFVTMAAPTFQRSWSKNLSELSEPNLFTRQPELKAAVYRALSIGEFRFEVGKELIVKVDGNTLTVCDGLRTVGQMQNPPSSLLEAVMNGNGIALGIVQSVLVEGFAANISVS
jgi:hypothetical protein